MCVFFSSFLVHFVTNIPDDHMITIWTMLRTAVGFGQKLRAQGHSRGQSLPPSTLSTTYENTCVGTVQYPGTVKLGGQWAVEEWRGLHGKRCAKSKSTENRK